MSRIEVQPYSHSLKVALAVTVDAAINSGNSGGPVMNQKGELIGIAFQALEGAEAIGHIVPPVVIKHFLHGIRTFGSQYRVIFLCSDFFTFTIKTINNQRIQNFEWEERERESNHVWDVSVHDTVYLV